MGDNTQNSLAMLFVILKAPFISPLSGTTPLAVTPETIRRLMDLDYFSLPIFICSKGTSLLKKSYSAGCSKMPRCKATEIQRSETYLDVRRNDEG
jgi:hypothetical protein